jgi:hypothetical protein
VDPAVRDRYLGIVEARARTRRNGAVWQSEAVAVFERGGCTRTEALRRMLQLYCEGMHANEPVHTWNLP